MVSKTLSDTSCLGFEFNFYEALVKYCIVLVSSKTTFSTWIHQPPKKIRKSDRSSYRCRRLRISLLECSTARSISSREVSICVSPKHYWREKGAVSHEKDKLLNRVPNLDAHDRCQILHVPEAASSRFACTTPNFCVDEVRLWTRSTFSCHVSKTLNGLE